MTFYKMIFRIFTIIVIVGTIFVSSKPVRNQGFIRPRQNAPTTKVYNFTIQEATLAPDGFTRIMKTVNGQYPGPLMEINKGDTIRMTVTNKLNDITSIHTHGIVQRGTPWYDGITGVSQCPIPNNYTYTYEFTPNQTGTYWYHSHAKMQYVDGIFGPLIIHDPDDPYLHQYDEEITVILNDYYHTDAQVLFNNFSATGADPVPDNGLINGKNNYDCSLAPPGSKCIDNAGLATFDFVQNKTYRIRIINTSAFTEFYFSIDKHEMEVIEVEGSYTKPNKIHRLPINVSQRYSVLVTANQPVGNYVMRSEFEQHCLPTIPGVPNPPLVQRAIVRYAGAPNNSAPIDSPWNDYLNQCVDLDSSTLQPLNASAPPASTRQMSFTINVAFDPSARDLVAYLNGSSYTPDSTSSTLNRVFAGQALPTGNNAFTLNGEVVDITFFNNDSHNHPLHMHGHSFWVLGFGNGTSQADITALNTVNPIQRDTASVPPNGYIVLRFVADNPGIFPVHCHMEWHLGVGLLMQLVELPDQIQKMKPPQAWFDLCNFTNNNPSN